MSFEVLDKDLAARIGRLKTRRGVIETPYLFPVVNPFDTTITAKDIEALGFPAVITNVLHVKRGVKELGIKDVHDFLGFSGSIMTDSGAYQLLVYGHVDLTPSEVIELQENYGSDIAVFLDYPTGNIAWKEALKRVEETVKRAHDLMTKRRDTSILWVGPIQGAPYKDLVELCAKKMSRMNFDVYALGSPTQIMESYRYDLLFDIIYTAKRFLPLSKPLHLFGAGHPMMLSLAVALGCDLFDSASYILYAKEGRYMTPQGTYKLSELDFFPCSCPVCSKLSPRDLASMSSLERTRHLALHNLFALKSELNNIKQAIREGLLWELVTQRCRSHPRLYSALRRIKGASKFLESLDPSTKAMISGIFFYDSLDLYRPEVVRHVKKLTSNCWKNYAGGVIMLLPRTSSDGGKCCKLFMRLLHDKIEDLLKEGLNLRIAFYGYPFCLVPLELENVYPLSQYEAPCEPDSLTKKLVSSMLAQVLMKLKPRAIVLYNVRSFWRGLIESSCKKSCKEVLTLDTAEPFKDLSDVEKLVYLVKQLL